MPERVRVDIETVRRIREEQRTINHLNLADIDWYENGVKLDIPVEDIETFEFTGLCNMDFVHPRRFTIMEFTKETEIAPNA